MPIKTTKLPFQRFQTILQITIMVLNPKCNDGNSSSLVYSRYRWNWQRSILAIEIRNEEFAQYSRWPTVYSEFPKKLTSYSQFCPKNSVISWIGWNFCVTRFIKLRVKCIKWKLLNCNEIRALWCRSYVSSSGLRVWSSTSELKGNVKAQLLLPMMASTYLSAR